MGRQAGGGDAAKWRAGLNWTAAAAEPPDVGPWGVVASCTLVARTGLPSYKPRKPRVFSAIG